MHCKCHLKLLFTIETLIYGKLGLINIFGRFSSLFLWQSLPFLYLLTPDREYTHHCSANWTVEGSSHKHFLMYSRYLTFDNQKTAISINNNFTAPAFQVYWNTESNEELLRHLIKNNFTQNFEID